MTAGKLRFQAGSHAYASPVSSELLSSARVFSLSVDTWEAVAAIATAGAFLIAGLAACVAVAQLRQNRITRLDQSRPYVVVSFRPGIAWNGMIDIIIENVGAGPARDVTIRATPPLQRAHEGPHPIQSARYFSGTIPLVPPKYSLRTYFDKAGDRAGREDLPTEYTFKVEYHDGHGHRFEDTFIDDTMVMSGLLIPEQFSTHHVGKALREIRDLLKRSPVLTGRNIEVTTEGRETRAQRLEEERAAEEEQQRLLEAEIEEARGRSGPSASDS